MDIEEKVRFRASCSVANFIGDLIMELLLNVDSSLKFHCKSLEIDYWSIL